MKSHEYFIPYLKMVMIPTSLATIPSVLALFFLFSVENLRFPPQNSSQSPELRYTKYKIKHILDASKKLLN